MTISTALSDGGSFFISLPVNMRMHQWKPKQFQQRNCNRRRDSKSSFTHLQKIAKQIWFEEADFPNPDFVKEKVWPTKWETVINEISRVTGDFRDYHIVDEIRYHFAEYDRIYIVYGGSHLVRQEPVLEALFLTTR